MTRLRGTWTNRHTRRTTTAFLTERTATRRYACRSCAAWIAAGERYFAGDNSEKLCAACGEAAVRRAGA